MSERLSVNDKSDKNTSSYIIEGFGLHFNDFTDWDTEASFMTDWELVSEHKTYRGNGTTDLFITLNEISKEYGLTRYSARKSDVLVIYTDRLWELSCYLSTYIDNEFKYYFQVLDHIEFRKCWDDTLVTAKAIQEWATNYINNLFVPDKYFYITKSQIFRKRIKKACKKDKVTLGKDLFPKNYNLFQFYRHALFGGICYCPYPSVWFQQPIIEIDLKSAYIYCFLKKHCVSEGKFVDTSTWEIYLGNSNRLSIGTYEITYTSWSSKAHCYKNIKGEHCKPTEDGIPVTDTFTLNSIDLKLMLGMLNVTGIKCCELVEFELGRLPKTILDKVVEAFIDKDEATGAEKKIKKVVLNSIYGNTVRKADTYDDWKYMLKNSDLSPLWGILITTYCKELVIGLGSKLEGWIYSDTDSIFCIDTPENRKMIEEFNDNIRADIKGICEELGYDYNKLKNLGTFCLEEEISEFKAWKPKTYAFTRTDGSIIRKAAGCNRNAYYDENIYFMPDVPIGEKVLDKTFINHPVDLVKDGVHYHEESSYILNTFECDNEMMLKLMEIAYLESGTLPY